MKSNIREEIAAAMVAALGKGIIPWRKPWTGSMGRPRNANSQKPYRGGNAFYLGLLQGMMGYSTGQWLTFNGAKTLGGSIRKGEKGTQIFFWQFIKKEDKATGKETSFPYAKPYYIWNLDQTEGCQLATKEVIRPEPIAAAEAIFRGMPKPPTMLVGEEAFYNPTRDAVTLPMASTFRNMESYYATMFHELAHSTGHASRLDRKLDGSFGSDPYSREELVAEMTASFLCGECGIFDTVQENSEAYVQHWAAKLGSQPMLILEAAGAAQKAADYILNVKFGEGE